MEEKENVGDGKCILKWRDSRRQGKGERKKNEGRERKKR